MGLLLITTDPPKVDQPIIPAYIQARPRKDYDRDVLKPLRKAQADKIEAERRAAEAAERARLADLQATIGRVAPAGTYGNGYAWLQCTWYVASRIPLPAWLGNANTWDSELLATGWRQGPPRQGAIAQSDGGYWGHVAVVEDVQAGRVRISEYNFVPFTYGERWVPTDDFEYFY